MSWMRDVIGHYPFDYIIGGLHLWAMFAGSPRCWGPEVERAERFARYDAYYEIMQVAASGMVDVVAHPDFVKVCCYDDFQAWLALPGSTERIAAVLEAMRSTDTAMEVSAGLRKPFHEPYPGPAIMRLAADIGLTIRCRFRRTIRQDTGSHFSELAAYAAVWIFAQPYLRRA